MLSSLADRGTDHFSVLRGMPKVGNGIWEGGANRFHAPLRFSWKRFLVGIDLLVSPGVWEVDLCNGKSFIGRAEWSLYQAISLSRHPWGPPT